MIRKATVYKQKLTKKTKLGELALKFKQESANKKKERTRAGHSSKNLTFEVEKSKVERPQCTACVDQEKQ